LYNVEDFNNKYKNSSDEKNIVENIKNKIKIKKGYLLKKLYFYNIF
jgi:hypothetical protein